MKPHPLHRSRREELAYSYDGNAKPTVAWKPVITGCALLIGGLLLADLTWDNTLGGTSQVNKAIERVSTARGITPL